MCLAMPACRLSSWSIRPCGSRGAARWALDLAAIFAIRSDYRGLAVLLHEVQHPPPGVVAGVLPLGEGAVEEAVRRALVHVRLMRYAGLLQSVEELLVLLRRGRLVGACDQDQGRRLHLREVRLAAGRPPVEADASVQVRVLRGLIPRVRPAEAEADREQRPDAASIL